jgi:uncharacterized protein YdeI (YjbR/CyaY-like superfamily)
MAGSDAVPADVPDLVVADAAAWREWLGLHHGDEAGVWLLLARKGTTSPTSLAYDEALRAALCFGWIDGQVKARDTATYRQRFTPRRARSPWSARNAGIVAELEAAGLMAPPGLAEVERAKADGRWAAAYAGPATAEVPADLAAAIDADPAARATFDLLTKQNRYAIIWRVGQAKRPETRARRIEQFVAMLARGETVHPQRRRLS